MDDGAEVQKKKIVSSKGEIEQFRESFVWKDILNKLKERIEDHKQQILSLPATAHLGKLTPGTLEIRLGGYDGAIKAFEWMAYLLLDELILDIENKTNETHE